MTEETRQLIKDSGLKIDGFGHDPNNPAPQMSINCYDTWYRFGEEPWIKSELRSQHKLLAQLMEDGTIEKYAKENRK